MQQSVFVNTPYIENPSYTSQTMTITKKFLNVIIRSQYGFKNSQRAVWKKFCLQNNQNGMEIYDLIWIK